MTSSPVAGVGGRCEAGATTHGEAGAIDGLATGAVATSEITALDHELGDDAVEGGACMAVKVQLNVRSSLEGCVSSGGRQWHGNKHGGLWCQRHKSDLPL